MIRTITAAVEELRKKDPDTPVNYYMLRRWILDGTLPAVRSGTKYLLNMETLENYLKGQRQTHD